MRVRRELTVAPRERRGNYSASELTAVLLVCVAGIVIMLLFIGIRKNIDDVENGVCAAQVRAAAATNKVIGRDFGAGATACQTKYVTITATDDAAVKKQLAEAMRTCAHQWGRGELDLFNGPGYYCAPCSNIAFSEATRAVYAGTNGNIPGFHTYLQETKAPGGEVTYAEYLAGVTKADGVQSDGNLNAFVINTNKDQVVLFTYDKVKTDGDLIQQFGDLVGTDITPAEEAALLGKASWIAAAVGKTAVIAAGSGGLITAAVAAGPVGWVGLGIAAAAVGGYAIFRGSQVGATVATITYFSARYSEEWYIISATYITPNNPESIYVKACSQVAEATRSP